MRNHFLIIFILFLTSCVKQEENNLLDYSDQNKSYQIIKIEKVFNKNDSLIRQRSYFSLYDSTNRLINSDNTSFYFYNPNNNLSEVKTINKRNGTGRIREIIKYKYVYNQNNNLIKIIEVINNEKTIKTLEYDKSGNLKFETGDPESMVCETINYEYLNGKISKKTILEQKEISKVSEYKYDKLNQVTIEDWVFSGTNRMRTYYKYYKNNKLCSERDSSYSKITNPDQYVEFLTEYYYDKNDSIIEIRKLGRIAREKEFKVREKTKFEYKKALYPISTN